ncbi:hypothetical protein SDC9_175526 [bioreactor metagenome]|uniref:Uncharacterized protein n=1 Tax=bioreactor metagenome TaxID=1076179 RepID=A0A645GMI5_9ZZZZ
MASFIEGRKLFAVAAFTGENLTVTFSVQFHFLHALRTAGVRDTRHIFAVSAIAVLTHKHLAFFAVHFQHRFAAFRAGLGGDVFVLELAVAHLDFRNNFLRIGLHFVNERILLQIPGSDLLELPLPFGCQGRRFQFFRNKLQQLLAF